MFSAHRLLFDELSVRLGKPQNAELVEAPGEAASTDNSAPFWRLQGHDCGGVMAVR
jgi:hypothetical protein